MSKQYTRPKRKVKLRVWARDKWTCAYCGDPVEDCADIYPAPPKSATVDHKIPRSQGGGNDQTNLVTACYECNQAKMNFTHLDEYNREYSGRETTLKAALNRARTAMVAA
jgi:5-methylcytosine-specific restriction endonuclease McrA